MIKPIVNITNVYEPFLDIFQTLPHDSFTDTGHTHTIYGRNYNDPETGKVYNCFCDKGIKLLESLDHWEQYPLHAGIASVRYTPATKNIWRLRKLDAAVLSHHDPVLELNISNTCNTNGSMEAVNRYYGYQDKLFTTRYISIRLKSPANKDNDQDLVIPFYHGIYVAMYNRFLRHIEDFMEMSISEVTDGEYYYVDEI